LKNCFSNSCTPNCTNKECGDDGCGGSCGNCSAVPADYCLNSTTLRDYTGASGSCSNFKCSYPYTDRTCSGGCANGKCNSCTPNCTNKECGDDGCGGNCGTCSSAPADYCLNSTTLRDYTGSSGTCSNFKCSYPYTDRTCQYGCANNKCNSTCTPSCSNKECGDDGCGGSCGGCSNTPADYCLNSTTLRDYSGLSSCSNFRCDYKYTDRTCSNGCANGKCLNCTPDCSGKECGDDGCGGTCGACNSPPADVCVDMQTLRDYSPYGTCTNNKCEYPYTDKKCSYICEQNKCINDPNADAGTEIKDVIELKDIPAGKDTSVSDTSDNKDITVIITDTGKPSDKDTGLKGTSSDSEVSGCSCSLVE
ncbi:MAG: hypothetical protein N3B13_08890, partial [Deltaproteobacteria bacterium]|nr:hypothetical protein [Deltaproteobacteria bacterium]